MRTIVFTPPAQFEFREAQDWYQREAPGLGRHFLLEIDTLIGRMSANPYQFPTVHKNIRRALLQRFPYALLFVVEQDEDLTVIACFHGSRDPRRWHKRLS